MIADKQSKKQVQELLKKATRSLAAARRHMEDGDYDFASSRAYYATFYAMETILLTKSLVFSKHSAVISAFNEKFLRTGIFPKAFSKLITRLFRERQIGDYEIGISIRQDEAKEAILSAEKIVNAIEGYLRKHALGE